MPPEKNRKFSFCAQKGTQRESFFYFPLFCVQVHAEDCFASFGGIMRIARLVVSGSWQSNALSYEN